MTPEEQAAYDRGVKAGEDAHAKRIASIIRWYWEGDTVSKEEVARWIEERRETWQ